MNLLIEQFIQKNMEGGAKGFNFLVKLDEAQQLNVSDKLIGTLYKTAIEKYNYIDFGDIPESKGDITRLKEFDTMTQTLKLLQDIKQKSGIVKLDELDTIQKAFQYIQDYKTQFCAGFLQNKSMVIVMYNTLVASVICGINLIICTMIDYIRTPGGEIETIISIQKTDKSMEYMLIKNLAQFNDYVEKGELKKFFTNNLDKQNFIGAATAVTATVAIAGAILIVPLLRELIYYVYNVRMSISQYFETQAEFLQLNANNLKFNPSAKTSDNKKNVIANQEKTAKKLKSISSKVRVKFENAETNSKKELSSKVSVDSMKSSMANPDDSVYGNLTLV